MAKHPDCNQLNNSLGHVEAKKDKKDDSESRTIILTTAFNHPCKVSRGSRQNQVFEEIPG